MSLHMFNVFQIINAMLIDNWPRNSVDNVFGRKKQR